MSLYLTDFDIVVSINQLNSNLFTSNQNLAYQTHPNLRELRIYHPSRAKIYLLSYDDHLNEQQKSPLSVTGICIEIRFSNLKKGES